MTDPTKEIFHLAQGVAAFLGTYRELEGIEMEVHFNGGTVSVVAWKFQLSRSDFSTLCRVFGKQDGGTYALEVRGSDSSKTLHGVNVFQYYGAPLRVNFRMWGAFECAPKSYSHVETVKDLSEGDKAGLNVQIAELQEAVTLGVLTTSKREILDYDCKPSPFKDEGSL